MARARKCTPYRVISVADISLPTLRELLLFVLLAKYARISLSILAPDQLTTYVPYLYQPPLKYRTPKRVMMKASAFIATTMALASAAATQHPIGCVGDPTIAADITVPVVLPIPGTSIIAIGNVSIVTFSNGTLILKKLLLFPGLNASTGGIDISIPSSLRLHQEEPSLNVEPLDPEVVINIEPEEIDVTINGVDDNTAVDIFV